MHLLYNSLHCIATFIPSPFVSLKKCYPNSNYLHGCASNHLRRSVNDLNEIYHCVHTCGYVILLLRKTKKTIHWYIRDNLWDLIKMLFYSNNNFNSLLQTSVSICIWQKKKTKTKNKFRTFQYLFVGFAFFL